MPEPISVALVDDVISSGTSIVAGLRRRSADAAPVQIMACENAIGATDLLRAAQIPFALDPATGGITVPEKNLHDARLKLADTTRRVLEIGLGIIGVTAPEKM